MLFLYLYTNIAGCESSGFPVCITKADRDTYVRLGAGSGELGTLLEMAVRNEYPQVAWEDVIRAEVEDEDDWDTDGPETQVIYRRA